MDITVLSEVQRKKFREERKIFTKHSISPVTDENGVSWVYIPDEMWARRKIRDFLKGRRQP